MKSIRVSAFKSLVFWLALICILGIWIYRDLELNGKDGDGLLTLIGVAVGAIAQAVRPQANQGGDKQDGK